MRKSLFQNIGRHTNGKKKTRQGQSHITKYGTKISKKYYKKRKRGQG